MKTLEKLQENYDRYFRLLNKHFGESAGKLEEALGERLATAPRGQTLLEGGQAGDLVEFCLQVARKSKLFAEDPQLQRSLVRVALLYELGKLGDDSNEQFVQQDSSWHQEKLGQYFKYNDKCEKMSYTHRTLYFLSKFGFQVSTDEWIAIITSGGFHLEENRFYARDNHILSHLFQACKCLADAEHRRGLLVNVQNDESPA